MSPSLNSTVVSISEVPTSDSNPSSEARQPVILIADDERVIADTLAIILSRSGFTTFTASDGLQALEMAELVSPQLLISDVVMPGMTGVELAIALTSTQPACKVLLFSGQAATVDLLAQARQSGHNFTALTKPVHPTDLLKRVYESLNLSSAPSRAHSQSHTNHHQIESFAGVDN
jgi:CheY-like chemotaxis protein